MSEKLRELLSAVIDAEADEFETRRVLDEAAVDAELRGVWDRFHLIRSVIARDGEQLARPGLRERMWERIDSGEFAELGAPETTSMPAAVGRRWANPVTGFAVAAAVALAVVIGYSFEGSNQVAPAQLVAAPLPDRLSSAPTPVGGPAPQAFPNRNDVQRAQAYMLHHAQHRGVSNRASVLPFVKVVAFEAD